MNNKYLIYMIFLSVVLGGCTLGQPYEQPASELPDTWRAAPAQGQTIAAERWWMLYNDATLDRLIAEALEHNQDLALATARLDEARALARVADAEQVPSVDAAFQRDRARRSNSTATRFPGSRVPGRIASTVRRNAQALTGRRPCSPQALLRAASRHALPDRPAAAWARYLSARWRA